MSKNDALSLRSQWLGDRLRAARNAAGYKLSDVGEYLGLAIPTLSRFEAGAIRIRKSYVRDLVDYYGVRAHDRAILLQLIEDSWRRDWWDGDIRDLEKGFIDYTWLEARAEHLQSYESALVHGLLQIPGYARAVVKAGVTDDEDLIDRMVEIRMTRQRILTDETPRRFSFLIESSAMERPVGGDAVHKIQLRHLIDLSAEPNIDIRILPPSVGWLAGHAGPFTLFGMRDPYPDVVYLDAMVSRMFLEEEGKVAKYQRAYDELLRVALPPDASRGFIEDRLKELS